MCSLNIDSEIKISESGLSQSRRLCPIAMAPKSILKKSFMKHAMKIGASMKVKKAVMKAKPVKVVNNKSKAALKVMKSAMKSMKAKSAKSKDDDDEESDDDQEEEDVSDSKSETETTSNAKETAGDMALKKWALATRKGEQVKNLKSLRFK